MVRGDNIFDIYYKTMGKTNNKKTNTNMKNEMKQALDRLEPQEIIDYLVSRNDVVWATYETTDDLQYRIQETIFENEIGGESVWHDTGSFTYDEWYKLCSLNGIDLKTKGFEYYESQYEYYFLQDQEGFDWDYSKQSLDEILDLNDTTLPPMSGGVKSYQRHIKLENLCD